MSDNKVYSFHGPSLTSTMTFYPDANGVPLLTISRDGFTVRGVKVPQGPGEAEAVYNAVLELCGMKQPPRPEET